MGLLQNGYRHNLTHRIVGATNLDGWNPYAGVYNGHRAAANRNSLMDGFTDNLSAAPNGDRHPAAWIMPNKGGGMSSRNAAFDLSAVAAGVLGLPGGGSASFTISTNTPSGELIVSGSGTASFLIDTNSPLLTASINGDGTASFTIETSTPILGAEASLIGTTSFVISIANADILPVDDSPALRNATATFTFDGTLVRYGVGHMEGTTDVSDAVTNASVARAVWDELLAEHTGSGSAGLALATASSGGVDPTILAAAVWSYVSRTLTSGASVPADIAAAILAAAQVTPIKSDIKQVNSVPITGSGVPIIDPWRPA